jgi:hypothetical protein
MLKHQLTLDDRLEVVQGRLCVRLSGDNGRLSTVYQLPAPE